MRNTNYMMKTSHELSRFVACFNLQFRYKMLQYEKNENWEMGDGNG